MMGGCCKMNTLSERHLGRERRRLSFQREKGRESVNKSKKEKVRERKGELKREGG